MGSSRTGGAHRAFLQRPRIAPCYCARVFEIQGVLSLVLSVVLFAIKAFALVDCVARKPGAFASASQVSKNGWLVILGLAVLAHLVSWNPLGILNLLGTLAALVYLAQVRSKSF